MQEEKGEERGGGYWAAFFPEEGGFRGAWVKSDSISVHEKSALRLPFPTASPSCPHATVIPTSRSNTGGTVTRKNEREHF